MPVSMQGVGLSLLMAVLAAAVAVLLTLVLLQTDSDATLTQVVSLLGVGGIWGAVILLVSIERRLRAVAEQLGSRPGGDEA